MTDARLFHQNCANILTNMIMQLDSFEHCVAERIFKVYVCTMIHEIMHTFVEQATRLMRLLSHTPGRVRKESPATGQDRKQD